MKMNLDMSFEEGLNVMEALRKCAIKNGWDEDELDECGVLEEYASAVDAALAAMGIAACIDLDSESELKVEDEDFDDEDWDEDEEDDYFDSDDEDVEEDDCPYTLTPKGEFIVHALEAGVSFENACELADILFDDDEGE